MNLRRQYSLPNCTLTLDGLPDESPVEDTVDDRPILSILINMDVFFVGQTQRITGGRDLLENLVKAVNLYAQEYLSGLSHPYETVNAENQVQLERIGDAHLHRLTWRTEGVNEPQSLDLKTIQLFDLVEAVDQFVADNHTLPSLSLALKPLSRRYRQPDEPLSQRVVPATIGMLTLLIVGATGFLLPIPEVTRPTVEPLSSPTQVDPTSQPSP